MVTPRTAPASIRWFGETGCDDVAAAGGKGASLSRMATASLAVPPGFVVCAGCFARFLDAHAVQAEIADILDGLDVERPADLTAAADRIKATICGLPIPAEIESAIVDTYRQLGDGDAPVAVRSSAIAEDSGAASFAGQQETYLNVAGAEAVVDRVRRCWASFFGSGALFYRRAKGSLADMGMAVVVQRLIVPEKAGVLFTVDPVSRRRDRMTIEATWGFGEALVSGLIVPDNYQVTRPDGEVVRAFVPPKTIALTRDPVGGGLIETELPPEQIHERVLADDEIAEIVAVGLRVEDFFGAPQDVEWCIAVGNLYVLQSRPITTV
jgi:pyruvate, water dikinase